MFLRFSVKERVAKNSRIISVKEFSFCRLRRIGTSNFSKDLLHGIYPGSQLTFIQKERLGFYTEHLINSCAASASRKQRIEQNIQKIQFRKTPVAECLYFLETKSEDIKKYLKCHCQSFDFHFVNSSRPSRSS